MAIGCAGDYHSDGSDYLGKSACAVDGNNTGASDVSQTAANKPLTFKAIAWWLLLSAFGVILFMSFTSHATHTIAPVPLLWIAPLGLYLLSFIVCFGWPGLYRRRVWMILAQAFFIAFIVSSLEVGITLMLGPQRCSAYAWSAMANSTRGDQRRTN